MDTATPHPAPSPPPPGRQWTLPGAGLFKGLAVTGRNMVESFYKKDRFVTFEYPEVKRDDISPNFRNFPFLCFDGDDPKAGLRCTACTICETNCPPQCIYIVLDRDENGKSLKRPKVFDIDISVCMNCGICAEVCPFDSIYMDGEYELAGDDRFGGMLLGLDRLAKSADYHMQLRPAEAQAVIDKRIAEEEKKRAAAAAKAAKAAAEAKAKAEAEAEPSAECPAPAPEPEQKGGAP